MAQKPILLLHGALGSPEQLFPLENILRENNRVYTLCFRGHGGDDYTGVFTMEYFVEDILLFLEENRIQDCHIFGYSMGGYAALMFAARYPDRVCGIFTLGTKFDWNPSSAEKEAAMLNPDVMEHKIPAFAAVLEKRFAPVDWKDAVRRTADMMLELGHNPGLPKGTLQKINQKVTISTGSLDTMVSAEFSAETAGLIPNGKYLAWEGWPHPIEKADMKKLALQLETFFTA